MKLLSLDLRNFRNYLGQKIDFNPNLNIVIGLNAQGKSNLLEAINYLSIFSSFRNARDADMIKWGQSYFFIEGLIKKQNSEYLLTLGYNVENKKIFKVNGNQRKNISDLLGVFNSVVFSPEDLNIVKTGPMARRKFLDKEMMQLFPSYYFSLIQYHKILVQRNNLLKEIRGNINKSDILEIWNYQLIDTGSKIIKKRLEVLTKLGPLARLTHRRITNGEEELDLNYESLELEQEEDLKKLSLEEIKNIFSSQLQKKIKTEIYRGVSLIGPHRDDLKITINGVDARKFGSQGQQRTAALALKIAELELVKSETGEYPVLLLDDVMSELDERRRDHLLVFIGERVQTFITTTDLDFKYADGKVIRVFQGEIKI
ncbi:MAG: DNA replication/repair protein RecF [Dehalobacterium sp.]